MIQFFQHIRWVHRGIGLGVVFLQMAALVAFSQDRVLRKAVDVRRLPRERASEKLAVHLEGIIAYDFTQYATPGFIVMDDTGGVYVNAEGEKRWTLGDQVVITGETEVGNYATVARLKTLTCIGRGELPHGRRVTAEEIATGKCDYQRVCVHGVVITTYNDHGDPLWTWMIVKTETAAVSVALVGSAEREDVLHKYVDAEVDVEGVCIPFCNVRSEFLGARITIQDCSAIRVVQPPHDDPFDAPMLETPHLLHLTSRSPILHRRCVKGTVTATRADKGFFMLVDDKGIFVSTACTNQPAVGEMVEVSGFLDSSDMFVGLNYAVFRTIGNGVLPDPIQVKKQMIFQHPHGIRMLHPDFHGQIVQVSGTVQGLTRSVDKQFQLNLDVGGYLVTVDLGCMKDVPLKVGSLVQVTGACVMEFAERRPVMGFPEVRGFSLIVRSSDDLVVLHDVSWWTVERLVYVIGGLVLMLGLFLGWNAILYRRVESRSKQVTDENMARLEAELRVQERTRLAAELHDSFAQSLAGISMQVTAAELAQKSAPDDLPKCLTTVRKMLDSCRDEIRRCVWNLRAQVLENKDLVEALNNVVLPLRKEVAIEVHAQGQAIALSDHTTHALLRIAQELLANAVRHGHATQITVDVKYFPDVLIMEVRDNGCGFNTEGCLDAQHGHFGLLGIRERVKRLQGEFTLLSYLGIGTTARVRLFGKAMSV